MIYSFVWIDAKQHHRYNVKVEILFIKYRAFPILMKSIRKCCTLVGVNISAAVSL